MLKLFIPPSLFLNCISLLSGSFVTVTVLGHASIVTIRKKSTIEQFFDNIEICCLKLIPKANADSKRVSKHFENNIQSSFDRILIS